jgi:hypothetical protein
LNTVAGSAKVPPMRRWRRLLPALGASALLVICGGPGRAQASQEAAKRYFQNGVELITGAEPNYQDAFYQFQLAYQESAKSWKVLGNLGLCALKLERDADALNYYEQYFKKGGNEIAPEERTAIEQDLLLLRGNLATVHITSPVADLQIVDRRSGSKAPPQSYKLKDGVLDLQLRAGSHNLTASSGDRRLSWDVTLEPKGSTSHVFDFDAPVAPPPTAAAAPAVEAKPVVQQPPADKASTGGSSAGLRIGAYVALGVGAVGLGAGGYFLWQSSDYSRQSDEVFACDARPLHCTPAEKAEVTRLVGESNSAKTRAAIGFGVGGAAVVTGIVLLVVAGSSSKDAPTAASVTPWVGYRAAGVSGTF